MSMMTSGRVIFFVLLFCFISSAAQTVLTQQESNNFGINRVMCSDINGTSHESGSVTKRRQMISDVSSSTKLTITIRKGGGFRFGGFGRRGGGIRGRGGHHTAAGRSTADTNNNLLWISTAVLALAF